MSLDVVYTWVDDRWPGYRPALAAAAGRPDDLNPNRTRDNLELLRFSLRALHAHLPNVGRVWLVTQRPMVPPWLNRERVRVVHHDTFMDPAGLPTYNSFAIVAQLWRIEGLSERFLYVEDDRLLLRTVTLAELLDGERPRVFARRWSDDDHRRHPNKSPWNRALANVDALLDAAYGSQRRPSPNFAPPVFTRSGFERLFRAFPEAMRATVLSRFRGPDNVAPEVLFPWFLLHEGEAVRARRVHRRTRKVSLVNHPLALRAQLAAVDLLRPTFVTLNDDFGASPSPVAEAITRAWLNRRFPRPSPYERGNG